MSANSSWKTDSNWNPKSTWAPRISSLDSSSAVFKRLSISVGLTQMNFCRIAGLPAYALSACRRNENCRRRLIENRNRARRSSRKLRGPSHKVQRGIVARERYQMKSRLVSDDPGGQVHVLILDSGEEAFAALTRFANDAGITAASLTAIGAFEKATVGWFDFGSKTYKKIEISE